MSVPVNMPQLGESVTEGTVIRWLKAVGDPVSADEPLLEVSTDKVDTEIPSPASGVLLQIVAAEDDVVEIGGPLAIIGEPSEAPAPSAPVSAPAAPAQPEPAAAAPSAAAPAPSAPSPAAPAPSAPAPATPAPSAPAPADLSGATSVVLPALGESVTEGTVTRWLKEVGDSVDADEPLLEVSTDKVDTEIPSPVAGVLLEISVQEDETANVGEQLALIGAPGSVAAAPAPTAVAPTAQAPALAAAQSPAPTPPPAAPAPTPTPAAPKPVPAVATTSAAAARDAYVTPLVRKMATELGVDLGAVRGTGVGGRIRRQDVEGAAASAAAAAQPAAAPAAAPAPKARAPIEPSPLRGRTEKLSRLRKVIAQRMVESLQVSAQLTTVVEADVTGIANLRNRAKDDFYQREGVELSFLPFFAKAAVEALGAHPVVNASIDTGAGTVTYHGAEHLGVAVDTNRGLLVPVIRDAGDLSIGGLARRIADLAERTRTNKVTPDELSGGTFTLTNTGSVGALFDTPIINQPQVAILGVGAVVKRAVVVKDALGVDAISVRSMMYLALSYDHRLVDGADAARYLNTVKTRLEEAAFEADLGL